MTEDAPKRSLKTIDTMVRIVEALKANDGGGVTEIAEMVDMSPPTVYTHLSTLEQNRFVVKEGDEYRLGLRFLNVGGYVQNRYEVYPFAETKVEEIAEETGERAQFLVEEHGRGIVVCKETSPSAVPADTIIGKTTYLHASAAGKAILASMSDDRVEEVVDRWGLPPRTNGTVADEETLFEELDEIRSREYAFNDEESIEGLRSVGVSVIADGRILGALSVSGPTHRMKGNWYREGIPNILLGAANEIELKVTYE